MRQVNFVFSQPAAGLLGISLRRINGGEQSLLTRTVGAILVDIPPQTDYLTGMAKQARIADGLGPGAAKHVGERRGQFTVAAQRLRLGVQTFGQKSVLLLLKLQQFPLRAARLLIVARKQRLERLAPVGATGVGMQQAQRGINIRRQLAVLMHHPAQPIRRSAHPIVTADKQLAHRLLLHGIAGTQSLTVQPLIQQLSSADRRLAARDSRQTIKIAFINRVLQGTVVDPFPVKTGGNGLEPIAGDRLRPTEPALQLINQQAGQQRPAVIDTPQINVDPDFARAHRAPIAGLLAKPGR